MRASAGRDASAPEEFCGVGTRVFGGKLSSASRPNILLLASDHGHFLGQHGLVAKAVHMYEERGADADAPDLRRVKSRESALTRCEACPLIPVLPDKKTNKPKKHIT